VAERLTHRAAERVALLGPVQRDHATPPSISKRVTARSLAVHAALPGSISTIARESIRPASARPEVDHLHLPAVLRVQRVVGVALGLRVVDDVPRASIQSPRNLPTRCTRRRARADRCAAASPCPRRSREHVEALAAAREPDRGLHGAAIAAVGARLM
jgi:hypothetical protein